MKPAKSPFRNAQEEIDHLQKLLKQELQAELTYYKEKTLRTPLDKRVKEGRTWFPVQVTRTGFTTGENIKITLTKTNTEKVRGVFQNGQVVSVFHNKGGKPEDNPSVHGVVAKITSTEMQVVLGRADLPAWMFEAGKLGIDVYFDETSFREMERALNTFKAANDNREAELRDIVMGYLPAQFRPGEYTFQMPHLNESQNAALALVERTMDVGVIHGPPGTGKTTTLVAAIQNVLKTEPQVLVCAPSNMAVDVLTERLAAAGVRVLRLGHPVRVSEELQRHTLDQQFAEHPDYSEMKRLRRKAEEMFTKAGKWKRTYERGQRGEDIKEAKDLKETAKQIEDYILFDILKRAQAITCTLVGATAKILGRREFHTVFIDEAAQALSPATFIPALRAHRIIFAGDHCQLPPTVKSAEAAKAGLGISLMEAFYARQQGAHGQKPGVMLATQYRMNQHIMEFSNRKFYHGELVADESVANRVLLPGIEDPLVNQPMEFMDTAGCGFEEEMNPETLSRFNIEEANLLLAHLHRLLTHLQTVAPEAGFSIGILSPYKAQVQQLQDRFREHGFAANFPQHTFTLDTVDGFQGQERDIIYFSAVRSNSKGEIGFLGDTRRLNVAMTRARAKLVMIADSATVAQHPFFSDLVDYTQEIDSYGSAWELVSYL